MSKGEEYRNKTLKVNLYNLSILLYNLHKGNLDPDVGFEDADRTLKQLALALNKYVNIKIPLIESSLWSSNLLSEKGAFCHPEGKCFDDFVKEVVGRDYTFDKDYNFLREYFA